MNSDVNNSMGCSLGNNINDSPLAKSQYYVDKYDKNLLYPLARQESCHRSGLTSETLPFTGYDIWNAYELSWLNSLGKPVVAIGKFVVPCCSEFFIEAKSFKLYLNSFNQTKFKSVEQVKNTLKNDLSSAVTSDVNVSIQSLNNPQVFAVVEPRGICLDDIDIEVDEYLANANLLSVSMHDEVVSEILYSNLLKTNCPVTGQPDWGTVIIDYKGHPINKSSLLKYICSLRKQDEFHEQCIERVFFDVAERCQPSELTVCGRFLRRGGIDINPFRSNCKKVIENYRLLRQ